MKPIHLIPLSGVPGQAVSESASRVNGAARAEPRLDRLEQLAVALARTFGTPCRIRPTMLDISFALDGRRNQYYSTAVLERLDRTSDPDARVLGVTDCDLFVPVLTFVFGEAQLDGNCAVVSLARLGDEFYGLPAREALLRERLIKEAGHELGHTFGLRHCSDWRCVMASSHAVERLDVKGAAFCPRCRKSLSRNGYW
ncbi:MAG TPA: archaemetzincin family Zn-dependent metalloprotease [Bryobacteraceae bacterium]|nr:archaemetzincin family Zn-dependent metalloprotease [Bryobacteraceae bacterium]